MPPPPLRHHQELRTGSGLSGLRRPFCPRVWPTEFHGPTSPTAAPQPAAGLGSGLLGTGLRLAPPEGWPPGRAPPTSGQLCNHQASGHRHGFGLYSGRQAFWRGFMEPERVTCARGPRRQLWGHHGCSGVRQGWAQIQKHRHPCAPSMARGRLPATWDTRLLCLVSGNGTFDELVHFGAINEMSCPTNGGGCQSERMNPSLWKPQVSPIPPCERGRATPPQHPHAHLCGPAAPGA